MSAGAENAGNEFASLPPATENAVLTTYRAGGLGIYGAVLRYAGMPLEKIALYLNSTQVSGKNQLRQAVRLTFEDSSAASGRSFLAPFRVVGSASVVAWFLQYSVMGFVFQVCDEALSTALGVPRMPYGAQLMEDPKDDVPASGDNTLASKSMGFTKATLAPALSGAIESVVANRAEVQRYYGIQRFAQIEGILGWNAISRTCAPAYLVNTSRNCIMSATSFVITPVLYRQLYPQERKNQTSLFWFGLGMNVFVGNTIAITQQALWGRALDYAASNGGARNVNYSAVIKDGLKKEGISAFYTVPKWASRVLMNAPVQGTLPWFYNEVLPIAEGDVLKVAEKIYGSYKGETQENTAKTNDAAIVKCDTL
mmetsp:Transcript_29637/g.60518  ORF Transcript_29637/g.60518 Transcript_29637/m.60518 type:complete len:368 (-) Transcript_29637:188-1291(-)|eukprot:CAMPEP_0183320654 /NCGR_PEP_ID=MMETSP0160_2-20130417/66818_1 /TAXON_ID=2839 ORGANISM="Odontella Sinensis, Strain Grunow 1884" /NCGR_SAMPLE_ID=MMETSP0160_2 /ASSEMBLY_ACC=CAM_ASM_000250 /LENGTH=367 /DNA_ID=CAMNT_0025487383 /DNA_START=155 /DNA_END=1258 /DNA_ORIENTATION=+